MVAIVYRDIARTTAQKELATLRQFLSFCRDRNWTEDSAAKRVETPKNIKPHEVVPYTTTELARILAACGCGGRMPTASVTL